MFVNELGVLEIVYLGLLFAFLAHLEAEICNFGLSGARGGRPLGPPKAKLGDRVTRYILKMFVNELSVLENPYLDAKNAFLSYLQPEIAKLWFSLSARALGQIGG